MNEPQIGTGMTDVKVETNFTPAAVEQKSPEHKTSSEMVTTDPKTPLEEIKEPIESVESAPEISEPAKPSVEDKANDTARKAIEAQIRAEEAERKLKELQPKNTVPETKPDINDKSTWGEKYKDLPNDLETFLQARDEWAEAQGEKKARDFATQAEQQKQELAIKTEIARKGQESRAKHPDFDAVVAPFASVMDSIPILKSFVQKNPMGIEVAYELAKNPAVLQQLMQSDVWQAGEQLLNMAARLKKPAAPQITDAPEPIKPIGSRETVKPRLTELAEKDINGYMKTMNKRELAKKRA